MIVARSKNMNTLIELKSLEVIAVSGGKKNNNQEKARASTWTLAENYVWNNPSTLVASMIVVIIPLGFVADDIYKNYQESYTLLATLKDACKIALNICSFEAMIIGTMLLGFRLQKLTG